MILLKRHRLLLRPILLNSISSLSSRFIRIPLINTSNTSHRIPKRRHHIKTLRITSTTPKIRSPKRRIHRHLTILLRLNQINRFQPKRHRSLHLKANRRLTRHLVNSHSPTTHNRRTRPSYKITRHQPRRTLTNTRDNLHIIAPLRITRRPSPNKHTILVRPRSHTNLSPTMLTKLNTRARLRNSKNPKLNLITSHLNKLNVLKISRH